ncbi:glutaredoxin-3-like protein [Caulochytrium protostelioides]|uniref:Glutaredoxin-3-like protein n=1 Tax=Caulochytrium protostelioides TaxID=1555241 RepID=A0A4P9WSX5_9FUNG|nr:glutaredoxin-3-like protein [Caulochytrium protostelioides]
MNRVFEELSRKFPQLFYGSILAEDLAPVSEALEIAAVPSFLIVKDGATVVERIEGAEPAQLRTLVEKYAKAFTAKTPQTPTVATDAQTQEALHARLTQLTTAVPVMVFIKGTPEVPRCGFSKQLTSLLAELDVEYGSFDILSDDAVRQGLKTFSNWPTFPQVYVNGELIGGLDIVKELHASGELAAMLPQQPDLPTRLRALTTRAPVMLFMKGDPETPRCGFSRQIVQILRDHKIAFESFDILSDEEIRQELKKFSNWPTYPQLYAKGEFIGGLDIVKELVENNELMEAVA